MKSQETRDEYTREQDTQRAAADAAVAAQRAARDRETAMNRAARDAAADAARMARERTRHE